MALRIVPHDRRREPHEAAAPESIVTIHGKLPVEIISGGRSMAQLLDDCASDLTSGLSIQGVLRDGYLSLTFSAHGRETLAIQLAAVMAAAYEAGRMSIGAPQ